MTESRRPRRLAETIRKHVADVFAREFFDPRLKGLTITQVQMGPDLSTAKLYVRALVGSRTTTERQDVEKAANRIAPTLRRGLGARLGIKKTPVLSFHYDDGPDAIDRIEELLGEINSEKPSPSD